MRPLLPEDGGSGRLVLCSGDGEHTWGEMCISRGKIRENRWVFSPFLYIKHFAEAYYVLRLNCRKQLNENLMNCSLQAKEGMTVYEISYVVALR